MDEVAAELQGPVALASAPGGTGGHRPLDPRLKRTALDRLGQVLRNDYVSVVQEPVPEALLALLKPRLETPQSP